MTFPEMQTEAEALRARYEALMRELGPNGFIDHVWQSSPGTGDYTAERQQPTSFAEIREQLKAMRAANGDPGDIG